MRVVRADQLQEGDKLGRSLYTEDGRLILRQGVVLDKRLIEAIKKRNLRYLSIETTPAYGADPRALKENLRDQMKDLLTLVLDTVSRGGPVPVDEVLSWSEHMAGIVMEERDLLYHYEDLLRGEGDLIAHSVNVCFLAMLTAKALGYSTQRIKSVAVGSLLHDIGLFKPHDGTMVINHPQVGYELLRQYAGLAPAALKIVAQHHEQLDGRGFPHGTKGAELTEEAQICGLCSEFDYFMNDKLADKLPCGGIEYVMSKIDTSYSYAVVRGFLKAFVPYPVGTEIRLTGGLHATVVELNKGHLARPVVRLNQFGTKFNLMEHPSFMVEAVV
ncbi:HD-GYP domain-containing protein [Cohnella hashimotonis]|uniref:HD domain-containing protein n=1 Tax=Cohnella hashimotonis TaxID=2826895 RepID=A0ABT6TL65_9BACL|nr:HD domain-containing protein [Cohnella hashimotonis]